MANTRMGHIDVISGIFILKIMLLHALQMAGLMIKGEPQTYLIILLYFSMPWFYCKAGFFHRKREFSRMSSTVHKRVVVPLVYFSIASIVLSYIFSYSEDRTLIRYILSPFYRMIVDGSVEGGYHLWFLMSFIFVKFIFWAMEKWNALWLMCLMPIIGWLLALGEVRLPLTLSTVPMGLFFYYMGSLYYSNRERVKIEHVILALVVFVGVFVFYRSRVSVHFNKLSEGNYFLWIATSLCGIVVFDYLFPHMENALGWLQRIGERTMQYYLLHFGILFTTKNIVMMIEPSLNPWMLFGIMSSVCVLCMPLLDRVLSKNAPQVFGLK